ncbi:aldehyde-activating protein [Sorangium cellulosum]|uniref:Aldehyde-activating protein n=1 Tax=Sorangium cellulosum TaxID=56 RepID=A0A2L0EM56_SORCE|nr:GFA family protein [Sorangium cellulosum]AUX40377.1 aldehyde-activating protein [Sorangium cellulosum]
MSESEHTGGCLCGAIRYRARGAPASTNICYCTQCRRQTGAPLPAFATYPEERFTLLSGQPVTYRSSQRAVRQFCGVCGSALFWRQDGAPTIDIFLGTMDRPADLPPPAFQQWTVHRVPWLLDLPGIPSHRAERSASAG